MDLTRVCNSSTSTILTESADFLFYRGTTFRAIVKFKQSNTNPLPISGKVINFTMAKEDGTNILFFSSSLTTSNGSKINIIDDLNGIVEILITDEETQSFVENKAKWWLTLSLLNGDTVLRAKGQIVIKNLY